MCIFFPLGLVILSALLVTSSLVMCKRKKSSYQNALDVDGDEPEPEYSMESVPNELMLKVLQWCFELDRNTLLCTQEVESFCLVSKSTLQVFLHMARGAVRVHLRGKRIVLKYINGKPIKILGGATPRLYILVCKYLDVSSVKWVYVDELVWHHDDYRFILHKRIIENGVCSRLKCFHPPPCIRQLVQDNLVPLTTGFVSNTSSEET